MIIKVRDAGTVFSKIEYPDFGGLIEIALEYEYSYKKISANQFIFTVQVDYIQTEVGGINRLVILKSQSNFDVLVVEKLSDLHFYQLVRQATHRVISHIFNDSDFADDDNRILPETPLYAIKEDLSAFVEGFNNDNFGS